MNDIEAFFEHYADRYMASDVQAISEMYEAPFLAVREGRAIHLGSKTDVREHLTSLMKAYEDSGAARAEISGMDVTALGKSAVMVTVHWHIVSGTGALVRELDTTYHLLRQASGEWRVLSYTNHD